MPNQHTCNPVTEADRFWSKVDKSGPIPEWYPALGNCWLWTGTISSGKQKLPYGRFFLSTQRREVVAHRWAWQSEHGPIPVGLQLDHLCRRPSCVRPSHLEPVTPRVNVMRSASFVASNARKTHCPSGHPYDTVNTLLNRRGARVCRTCLRASFTTWYRRTSAEQNSTP